MGVQSNSNLSGFNAFAQTGIAYQEGFVVNPYNPAAASAISIKSFLFDIGMNTEISSVANSSNDERRIAANFSNVAIGFNPSGRWGVGLTLTPATNVGYSLIGIETNIEGSVGNFTSNVLGSGGINKLSLDYGRSLSDKFRAGLSVSYLFGNVEETESIELDDDFLSIDEKSHYNGFQFGIGVQYNPFENLAFGAVMDFPVTLKGIQDRIVLKTLDFSPILVEDETRIEIDSFQLPLEYGLGATSTHIKGLTINADYTRKNWGATNQEDTIGEYVDQDIFGFGMELIPNKRGFSYWQRINYRAGIQYDSGYLKVNDFNVSSYTFSAGIGLPFGKKGSTFNLSYSYANRGQIDGILIEENSHLFNINLTLSDVWFLQRKID
ncbi:MAG: membrane protein [Aureisphaera sp.]